MKKRCIGLAVMLLVLQVALVLAPTSVSAKSMDRSYNIYKTDAEITVDGVIDAAWADLPYTETFVVDAEVIPEEAQGFEAKMQMAWKPVEGDDTQIQVYLVAKVKDPTPFVLSDTIQTKKGDVFGLNAYYGDTLFWTGLTDVVTGVNNSTWFGNNDNQSIRIQKAIVDNRLDATNPTDHYVIELGVILPKSDKLVLDLMVYDNYLGANGSQLHYSWNGSTSSLVAEGVANVLHSKNNVNESDDVLFRYAGQTVASAKKDANGKVTVPDYQLFGTLIGWKDGAGKLYPVGGSYTVSGSEQVILEAVALTVTDFELLGGASAYIKEPTAIRFEVRENAEAMASLSSVLKGKGVLIVETEKLTDAILADGTFTAEELTAAGVPFDKVPFDLTHQKLYRAEKNGIVNMTTSYSAVAYLTVEYADGSTHSLTSDYSAEQNARSIKEIATAAYADRNTVRAEMNGLNYKFKVSKDYAVGSITYFSYSPYTEEQLDLLAQFMK